MEELKNGYNLVGLSQVIIRTRIYLQLEKRLIMH